MVLPAGLLERTGWRENPLVRYSERRARRPLRFIALRLFEAVILAVCMVAAGFVLRGVTQGGLSLVVLFVLAFLLLRYHLYANDQSMVMKTLSLHHLQELMLTQLGGNEFFRHHLLIFCRTYRLVFVFAILTGFYVYHYVRSVHTPATFSAFMILILILVIMMQMWLGGIYQYIAEWKWFAGGRLPALRSLMSLGLSAAISFFILLADVLIFMVVAKTCGDSQMLFAIPAAYAVVWAGAFALVYHEAKMVDLYAMQWLTARLDPAFNTIPYRLLPFDFLIPLRFWSAGGSFRKFALPDVGMLVESALYGVLFSCSLYGCFAVMENCAASIAAFPRYAIMAALGAYFGLAVAGDESPPTRERMKRVLPRLGIYAILMTGCYAAGRLREGLNVTPGFVFGSYIENITCGMIALGTGVITPGLRRRSVLPALAAWGAAAILIAVVSSFVVVVYADMMRVRVPWAPRQFEGNAWTALITYFIAYIPTRLALGRLGTSAKVSSGT